MPPRVGSSPFIPCGRCGAHVRWFEAQKYELYYAHRLGDCDPEAINRHNRYVADFAENSYKDYNK